MMVPHLPSGRTKEQGGDGKNAEAPQKGMPLFHVLPYPRIRHARLPMRPNELHLDFCMGVAVGGLQVRCFCCERSDSE
jgi:hypothetical protein